MSDPILHVVIVSATGRVREHDVTMVTLPGDEGQLGIMAGHAPLVTFLKPGVIHFDAPASLESYFISGGMAQVDDDCKIICDDLFLLSELDPETAEKEYSDYKNGLPSFVMPSMEEKLEALRIKAHVARHKTGDII